MLFTKETEFYEGFIIPKEDAHQLKINDFKYEAYEECFKGMLETEEGALRSYEYYPTNHHWHLVVDEENY